MLKTRILTALALLPLVLGCLFFAPAWAWGLFALFALTFGAWEWSRFSRFDRTEANIFIATFAALGASWLLLPLSRSWAVWLDMLALPFWFLIIPLWLSRKWTLSRKPVAALLGWLILLAALAGVTRMREMNQGAWVLLAILAIAWVADIAAYFAGRTFGKHKLAPSISPGKTWEGVAGALVAVSIYVVLLHGSPLALFATLPLPLLLPLAWLLTAISVIGDLFESLLKRQVGLKDSSQLLPGHGGVLDRIDSLLSLVPVSTAMLFSIAPLVV